MEGLQKMKAKPKMIYTDGERGIASAEWKEYVDGEGIELYRTRNHPAFAERFIRTFKDKLFKRVENDEKKGKAIQYVDYIFEIMLTYNNKYIHSATGLTPNEARKEKNEFEAKLNVSVKARKDRTYPTLEVGDKVKIMRKKAITEKEKNNWLAGEYVEEEIFEKLNQKYYRLTGYNKPLMRHEMLKVKKDGKERLKGLLILDIYKWSVNTQMGKYIKLLMLDILNVILAQQLKNYRRDFQSIKTSTNNIWQERGMMEQAPVNYLLNLVWKTVKLNW